MRLLLVPVLLALTLIPAASAGLPNACTLLTNAEVAKVFGAKIADRTKDAYGGCTWNGVTPNSFTSYHDTLSIQIVRVTRAQFDKWAKRAKNAVRVRGLGDAAFSQYTPGEFLSVWQNGIYLSVELGGGTSPITQSKALAREALARL
jgi:hypothetical protein